MISEVAIIQPASAHVAQQPGLPDCPNPVVWDTQTNIPELL